ncbi:hypothetical protein [Inquilinus sp. Marseille-Q2685]|uniref:hypothetical protein n=1 Tax=Inquilinus sp. Marseille-Q2685 TaxID=2866581 RepID=UPI001CE43712|nr:hypothetical protein [Inquilinus sp. Marseille-Q2685]
MPQLRPDDLSADEKDALGRIHRHEPGVADHVRLALQARGLIEERQGKWALTNDGSVLLASIGLGKLDT